MKVLVYSQKLKEEDAWTVREFFNTLTTLDIEYKVFSDFVPELDLYLKDFSNTPHVGSYEELIQYMPDLVITLGGDGTILNAITIVRDTGIPILGVNMGRLGFLSNVEKSKITHAVQAVASNNFTVESRSMIRVTSNIPIFEPTPYALNDFTLHKRDTSSMITIHTYVNDEFLNSYWADGLIVSTPTGSTGYSLSCGGPIVFPGSGNFIITPVAPHNLNVRPLVLSDTNKISLVIEGRSENFLSTLDSRYETVTHEHKITLSRCEFNVRLAMVDNIDFKTTIRQKLMWGLDKRN